MTFTTYEASVPVFIRGLRNLSIMLDQASANADRRKFNPTILVNARLAPDMYTLAGQVQTASDIAKGCVGRLAEIERPNFLDVENSFPELRDRITRTVTFIESIDPTKFSGGEDRLLTIKLFGESVDITGQAYLLQIALPNFYFHVSTAYNILRHNGVELGKADYLGSP
jgi:uncharacterized protein